MLKKWLKLLLVFFIVAIVYGGCNTNGMLATEEFFRVKNPKLSMTPKVCYILATSAFRTFRYKLSIEITDRNLKDFPYESAAVDAKYRRAVAYEKLGKYKVAVGLYEAFLLENPKDNRYKRIVTKISKLRALHLGK